MINCRRCRRPKSVWASSHSAISPSTSMSSAICFSIPGRWTLTTRAAVAQRGRMHLPQRGGRQRHFVKTRKRLRQPHAQLARDNLFDLIEGKRLHPVMQARQRDNVGRGHQVRPARQHLAELDVGRTHRLQVVGVVLGRRAARMRRRRFVALDGSTAVPMSWWASAWRMPQQASELLVTLKMLHGQFHTGTLTGHRTRTASALELAPASGVRMPAPRWEACPPVPICV